MTMETIFKTMQELIAEQFALDADEISMESSFAEDLQEWGPVCDRMHIWDYTTCFAHYPSPHPNWHCLQPNMQLFAKNGVKGVYEQANRCKGGGVDLNELRAYVISKLLWDPDTTTDRKSTRLNSSHPSRSRMPSSA